MSTHRVPFRWVLVLLLAASVGAAPIAVRAEPVAPAGDDPPDGWTRVQTLPAWASTPPSREGYVRYVDVGMSNLVHLAVSRAASWEVRVAERVVARRLAPVLGEEAAGRAAAAGAAARAVVEQAVHVQPPAPGKEAVPGAQVVTAWTLWEIPLDAILADVAGAERDAAHAALTRSTGTGPAWEEVAAAPAWVREAPAPEGSVGVVQTERARDADMAKALAGPRAHSILRSRIQRRIQEAVGREAAFPAADAAAAKRILARRAIHVGRASGVSEATAWLLWHVPVNAVLAALPEGKRPAARAALIPR